MPMDNTVYFQTALTERQEAKLRVAIKETAVLTKTVTDCGTLTYGIHIINGRMSKSIALQYGIIIGAIQVGGKS